jgi:hypothetical protein
VQQQAAAFTTRWRLRFIFIDPLFLLFMLILIRTSASFTVFIIIRIFVEYSNTQQQQQQRRRRQTTLNTPRHAATRKEL